MSEISKKTESQNAIILFKTETIRRAWHENEWWFSIADVVKALTGTVNPTDYIKKMCIRDEPLSKGWGQFVTPLSIETRGGKQKINCANTESLLRIIQSVPSPKAEPFKLWLAKVGYERIQEIENPELSQERMTDLKLVFALLSEKVTTKISSQEKPGNFEKSKKKD